MVSRQVKNFIQKDDMRFILFYFIQAAIGSTVREL